MKAKLLRHTVVGIRSMQTVAGRTTYDVTQTLAFSWRPRYGSVGTRQWRRERIKGLTGGNPNRAPSAHGVSSQFVDYALAVHRNSVNTNCFTS